MSLTEPHAWLEKLHIFARTVDIEQPINLAEKTGATGSSPMFLLALGCMLGVSFENLTGDDADTDDDRTARRRRRTATYPDTAGASARDLDTDTDTDGANVYSSASRTYTPGDFDRPPDTATYICNRAGVESIDQVRFKNSAKMEASGQDFHKDNSVLADAMRVAINKNRPIINYLARKGVDYSNCNDGGLLFLHAITYMLSEENEVPGDVAERRWTEIKQREDETSSDYHLRFNRMCKALDHARKHGAFEKSPKAKAKRFCITCSDATHAIIAPNNDEPDTMTKIVALIDKDDATVARRALAFGNESDDAEPGAAAMAATNTTGADNRCTHCGLRFHTADECRRKDMSSDDAKAAVAEKRGRGRRGRKTERAAATATTDGASDDSDTTTFAAFSALWHPVDSDGEPMVSDGEEHEEPMDSGDEPMDSDGGYHEEHEDAAEREPTDGQLEQRRSGMNWSQLAASAATACVATIATLYISNGFK